MPNADATTALETRLAVLEREVAELKQTLSGQAPDGNWLARISGTFRGDPEFDEILRLGREFRASARDVD